jgi:hypothetical protein
MHNAALAQRYARVWFWLGAKFMRRREFIALIGSAAVARPLAARAQEPGRTRRIGLLMSVAESDPEAQDWLVAFRERLQQLGWTEGRNIRIDYLPLPVFYPQWWLHFLWN